MKDLEKRVSIIEEKLGINKVNIHVGLKFTTANDRIIHEITSISDEYLKVGWKGIKDRVDYLVCKANIFFNSGAWKVYEPTEKFAELKEAHRNGAVIEYKSHLTGNWLTCKYKPNWSENNEYRIKPTQESSLEQDIQQLKDKYKQYKFTITIEDNI